MKIIFHHQGSATGGCEGCKPNLLPRFLSMGKTLVGAGYLTLQNVTDILDKGGGQSITKLHASTKNVALQLQGADQSNQNYFQFFLQTLAQLMTL